MNAHAQVQPASIDPAFAAHLGNVERWRGQLIQVFAEMEQTIEGLLIALHQSSKGGKSVKTGQPVGPAFGHIRDLTSGKGAFAAQGQALAKLLGQLAPAMEWRAHLTHGDLKLWRGREGQWLLTLGHRQVGEPTIRWHAISWTDATELLRELTKQVPQLAKSCSSLAEAVRA
jgi:hypothetical protein